MAYRMWKPNKSKDYALLDRVIAEQYVVGGVDMFLYTFQGATGNAGSTDLTKPDLTNNNSLLAIGNLTFGESINRKYNPEAIVLPVVYQVQEAQPDIKIPGLMFSWNTMDITVHYNTMMQYVGRKIMPGDVLELPNLRDNDVYGSNVSINKWYVVQDAFKSSQGYSQTWNHHIWKIRVKPLTDSPEFSDIVDKIKQPYPSDSTDPNDTNPDNNTGSVTVGDKALDMMNEIIKQADSEVPYMHWDNEHIYDDTAGLGYFDDIPMGFVFPKQPKEGQYFKLQTEPVLYENENNAWVQVPSKFGNRFPNKPKDGDFYFKSASTNIKEYYILYQYDAEDKKWYECTLPSTNIPDTVPEGATDFYYYFAEPVIYSWNGTEWEIVDESMLPKEFTSKHIAVNRTNHDDMRGAIPPKRGTIPEGTDFPSDPEDGMYFYRTDFTPAQIWQYSAETKKWTLFPYGGRLPWVGADQAQATYLNSKDRVSVHDVVKPNIKQ